MSARLLPIVVLIAAVAALAFLTLGSADEPARNPAAAAGDGEMYTWSGQIPDSVGPSTRGQAVGPASVIPPDERVRITDTTAPIVRSVAQLELYDSFGFFSGTCTGTLVGPDAVLTAAHCLYDPAYGWTGSVAVIPGKDEAFEPFGYEFASDWWVPDGWITSGGNPLYDWGVVKLPDSVLGSTVGWLSMGVMSDATLERSDFMPAIIGYPGDKDAGTEMWGAVKSAFLNVDQFLLQYDIDTSPGQSGSAIFSLNAQQSFGGTIVGIHTTGTLFYNQGTRIDISLLYDILTGCYVMDCSISAYIEGGPTVTPSPVITPSPTPTHSPSPPASRPSPTPTGASTGYRQGDANCSGGVDGADIAAIMKIGIGLPAPGGCATYQDNVNCLGGTDAADALAVAIYLAQANPLPAGGNCVPIGQYFPTGGATSTPSASRTPTRTPTVTPTRTPTPTPTGTPTHTPTHTPTLTPSKTPTPVPHTPTPTPVAGGFQLPHSTWYYDILDDIWVVGEVINNTGATADFVKVTANFYSASNQLLATDYGYACLNAIGPGGTSPYDVLLIGPPAGIDHVTVSVTGYYSPPLLYAVPPGLSVNISNFYTDIIDYVHAVGTVTNNSANTYDFVKVCSAFYNTAGDVVRTDFTYANPDTLGPHAAGTFDSFADGDGAGITSVKVWPDASYY